MRAGRLKHKVMIEEPPATRDAQGGLSGSWVEIAGSPVWASITPLSGSRRYEAAQVVQGVSHEITTRYLAGVTSEMKIVYGTRTFRIRSVVNVDERDRELRLLCEEVTA
jgi:SPP1 family predicted phage head-tail adaptor